MKRLLLDWGDGCGNGHGNAVPMPTVPSVQPPWKRPVESPQTNTLYGNATIVLTYDTTYLNQTAPLYNNANPPAVIPYTVALPNGNYTRQIIRIYVTDTNVGGSATPTAAFNVAGNFAGFTSLTFNTIGFSAVLEWTGSRWSLIGGNAVVNP